MIKIPEEKYKAIKEMLEEQELTEYCKPVVTCLICGKKCTSVGSHCKKHGLTAKEYRRKFALRKSETTTERYRKLKSSKVSETSKKNLFTENADAIRFKAGDTKIGERVKQYWQDYRDNKIPF
jgi:hypothetical protein